MSDEASAVMTEEKEFSAMTMEDFLRADEEAFGTPKHGDIVDGVVVRVDADEVLVDIGAKAEGIISGKELGFRGEPAHLLLANLAVVPFVGDHTSASNVGTSSCVWTRRLTAARSNR